MKSHWLRAAAVGAVTHLTAAGAFAAPPIPAPFTWTGFYVGLNAGGVQSYANANTSTSCTPASCYFIDTNTTNLFNSVGVQRDTAIGFVGGAQAGFNWQMGNFVTGLETDFQSFRQNGNGSGSAIYPTLAPATFTVSQSFSTDWLWTLRPRLGIATNSWLFYATGGVAITEIKAHWLFVDTFADTESASMSKTTTGWTIGGGAEYAMLNGWSLKTEYLYLDFGREQLTSNNLLDGGTFPVPLQPFLHSVHLTSNVFRLGLNYKFGAP
jgi:outer membrane immunogenic protein